MNSSPERGGDTASHLDAISLSLEREGGPPAVQTAHSEALTSSHQSRITFEETTADGWH